MKNFVNVDTRFQKSINLTLDTGDMALVNRYIPTRSSVSILKQYLTNIVRGQGEHATILIGPYGKGKYLKDEPYGGTVRVGIGQFNTKEDIRQLIHAVEEIARG